MNKLYYKNQIEKMASDYIPQYWNDEFSYDATEEDIDDYISDELKEKRKEFTPLRNFNGSVLLKNKKTNKLHEWHSDEPDKIRELMKEDLLNYDDSENLYKAKKARPDIKKVKGLTRASAAIGTIATPVGISILSKYTPGSLQKGDISRLAAGGGLLGAMGGHGIKESIHNRREHKALKKIYGKRIGREEGLAKYRKDKVNEIMNNKPDYIPQEVWDSYK